MSMICALCVSLSTIALVITVSPKISFQRSNETLVAIIIDLREAPKERLEIVALPFLIKGYIT